jgi:hypothetical protein
VVNLKVTNSLKGINYPEGEGKAINLYLCLTESRRRRKERLMVNYFYKLCMKRSVKSNNFRQQIHVGRDERSTFGKCDFQYLLCSLLSECLQFKKKEIALQYLGLQLGVQVTLSLIMFHANLAGEGRAKTFYLRRLSLAS